MIEDLQTRFIKEEENSDSIEPARVDKNILPKNSAIHVQEVDQHFENILLHNTENIQKTQTQTEEDQFRNNDKNNTTNQNDGPGV